MDMPRGKILLVDDDPDIVKALTNILANEGYEIITSYTGKRAIERVKEEKPDLVLLDIMMPDMDGLSVCMEIKNNPKTKNVKVIMLTSKDSGDTLQESLEKKADWFIAKPPDEKYLINKVNQFILKK